MSNWPDLQVLKWRFLLIPLASAQYIRGPAESYQVYRVWYVFGVRVAWYDITPTGRPVL